MVRIVLGVILILLFIISAIGPDPRYAYWIDLTTYCLLLLLPGSLLIWWGFRARRRKASQVETRSRIQGLLRSGSHGGVEDSHDIDRLQQIIGDLSDKTRAKSVGWVSESRDADTVATLSLVFQTTEPAVHKWASDSLWALLVSAETPEQKETVRTLTSGLDLRGELLLGAYEGTIEGLMRSLLGRELKAGEIETAERLLREHIHAAIVL